MSIPSKIMYLKAEFDLLVRLSLQVFYSHFELCCLFRTVSLIYMIEFISLKILAFPLLRENSYTTITLFDKEFMSQTSSDILHALSISFTNTGVFLMHTRIISSNCTFFLFEKVLESINLIINLFYYF